MFCPRLRAESHHTSDVGPVSTVRDQSQASGSGGFPASASQEENTVTSDKAERIIQLAVTSAVGILTCKRQCSVGC